MTEALLRLKSLTFEGAGTYRTLIEPLPLAKQGRVLIMGSEGAGKSMVPEVMTLVLYGKGSPRVRKSGLVESSIVNEAHGYQGTLAFDSGFGAATRHVSITQAFKHKRLKSRYIITVDGVREEPDTKPQQKKLVKRLAPLSYEEWLGVVYLHQGGIHDLLAGSPTEKREYLTSVFGLDFYDDLLTTAQEEVKALTKRAIAAGDLQQELANLEEEQRQAQAVLDDIPGGLAAVEAGILKLQDRLQKQSNDLGKLEAADDAFDTLADLQAQIESSPIDVETIHTGTAATELEGAEEDRDACQEVLNEIEGELRGLFHQKVSYDAASNRVTEAKAALAKTEEALHSYTAILEGVPDDSALKALSSLLHDAASVLGDLDFVGAEGVKVKKGTAWRAAAEDSVQVKATAKKLAKLVQAHTSECPTCETQLDEKALATTTKSLWDQADSSQKQAIAALRAEVFAVAQWWPRVPAYVGTIGEIADAVDNVRKVRSQYERLAETQTNQSGALKKAQVALKALPKPQSPEKLVEKKKEAETRLASYKTQVKNLAALVSLQKQYNTARKLVDGLSQAEVKTQLQVIGAKREKTKAALAETLKVKSECDQAASTIKHLKKRIQDVERRVQEHADTVIRLQHYDDTLVPFFTALRASKVRSCVSVLEGVLPVYVSAMSASQYVGAEVKLSVSDDLKDVDLMLRAGERGAWISAIQASGGQRRRFTMAIIAALREVSPRKANLMFFDEPFADLESDGKLLFVQRLIPTLMDRCSDLDSVFVIAHDHEVVMSAHNSFDRTWQVIRDETGSRIEGVHGT